jgi:STE24 endopeptidase
MEDMSKKGKRLEKENEGLKRQKEATNANIIRMAEERHEWKRKAEAGQKQLETLRGIIQAMQKQGRTVPANMASTLESCFSDSYGGGAGDEESDYSADEGEDLSEFEDDTEEEQHQQQQQPQQQSQNLPVRKGPVTYGPERPPPSQPQPTPSVNGH